MAPSQRGPGAQCTRAALGAWRPNTCGTAEYMRPRPVRSRRSATLPNRRNPPNRGITGPNGDSPPTGGSQLVATKPKRFGNTLLTSQRRGASMPCATRRGRRGYIACRIHATESMIGRINGGLSPKNEREQSSTRSPNTFRAISLRSVPKRNRTFHQIAHSTDTNNTKT